MKRLLFILLSFISAVACGQASIKEIREINPAFKEHKYVFPVITIPENTVATDKINNELTKDFLDIDRKKVKKSIFENVWATKEKPNPVLNDLSYKVLNNDKRLFSLSVSAEGCGAYCEYFTFYYSFDAKTGWRFNLDTLFNQQGRKLLLDSLNKGKLKTLETKLKDIRDTLSDPKKWSNMEDKEYYEDMKDLYEDCLKQGYKIDNFEYLHFYLTKDKLVIILDRCSSHMNRAVDELDDFYFEFWWKDHQKHLSAYGIRLTEIPTR